MNVWMDEEGDIVKWMEGRVSSEYMGTYIDRKVKDWTGRKMERSVDGIQV